MARHYKKHRTTHKKTHKRHRTRKSKASKSPWMIHVKKTMRNNKKLLKTGGLGAILRLASKTFKK